MEEILASIKKVIAEDKDARSGETGGEQPRHDIEEASEDEVLELSEELAPRRKYRLPTVSGSQAGD